MSKADQDLSGKFDDANCRPSDTKLVAGTVSWPCLDLFMETSGTILDLEPSWSLLHGLAACCLEVEHP
jgi:hypothetical protein